MPRIIIVGPTCSGKNVLRQRLSEKGYSYDVSYTTRNPREELGEMDGIDYNFISEVEFLTMIKSNKFHEHIEYNGHLYGTGQEEWDVHDVFIKETDSVHRMSPADREKSLVIFLNPDKFIREHRMREERGWSDKKIKERRKQDLEKFKHFKDYDLMITDPYF